MKETARSSGRDTVAFTRDLLSCPVSEISEGAQRVRRHRISALRVRLEEGGPRDTRGGHGVLQIARREGGRHPGVAGSRVPMEHHRPVGGGRGWDGVLLPVHAPGQSSTPLAQGLHPLRKYSPIFSPTARSRESSPLEPSS